jgi:hypothetical protein
MRKVFAQMEGAQAAFLKSLGVSPYDGRLRSWREKTLRVFERSWPVVTRRHPNMDEAMAGSLYVHLLARVMASEGVPIGPGILKGDRDMERLLKEVGL